MAMCQCMGTGIMYTANACGITTPAIVLVRITLWFANIVVICVTAVAMSLAYLGAKDER